jgi:hypothetical protein
MQYYNKIFLGIKLNPLPVIQQETAAFILTFLNCIYMNVLSVQGFIYTCYY